MSFPHSSTRGLFAPVFRTHDHTLTIRLITPNSPAELAEFRALYAQWLATGWYRAGAWNQRHAQLLARGDGTTRDILLPGLAHDLVMLPLFLAFLWSAYLNFFSPDIRRERRRLALLAAELCPKCRYDIASLRGTHTICPECGADITPPPSPPAPPSP